MPNSPIVFNNRPHDYAAFSDESHSDGSNSHMVIGGILVRSADAHIFSNAVSCAYAHFNWPESIQWKSISKAKIGAYKAVVDVVADWSLAKRIDFGCIIFDSRKIDHMTYNQNDPEKGFFKFLYQHHLKWSRQYPTCSKFRCFHGNMETGYDLNELHRCLNNSFKTKPPIVRRPYTQVDFLPVKRTRCMQIADLLIGAVGYACNGKYEANPHTPKAEIYRHLMDAFAYPDWKAETPWPGRGFHIWRFRL